MKSILERGVGVVVEVVEGLCPGRGGKTVRAAAGRAGDALARQAVLAVDAVALAAPLVVIVLNGAHVVLNVGPDSALRLHHLVHEDLLHLPVVEVVQVPDGVLGPGDEVEQDGPGGYSGHKLVLAESL